MCPTVSMRRGFLNHEFKSETAWRRQTSRQAGLFFDSDILVSEAICLSAQDTQCRCRAPQGHDLMIRNIMSVSSSFFRVRVGDLRPEMH